MDYAITSRKKNADDPKKGKPERQYFLLCFKGKRVHVKVLTV